MIPEIMALTSTGAITKAETGAGLISPAKEGATSQNSSPSTTTVNAISSSTFVVKLDSNGADHVTPTEDHTRQGPKTNLLQLFCGENGKAVNLVKALSIGRIVINRTLLKNKHKGNPVQLAGPTSQPQKPQHHTYSEVPKRTNSISISIPSITKKGSLATSDGRMVKLRTNSQPRVSEKENLKGGKDGDDLGRNLANFMNFKLSSVVPKPISESDDNFAGTNIRSPSRTFDKTRLNSDFHGISPLKPKNGKLKQEIPKEDSDDDNDLTSLSWLTENDNDLKKTIRLCNPDDAGISLSGDETDEEEVEGFEHGNKAVFTASSKIDGFSQGGYSPRQYNQMYNPNGKPPYSFSCLIFMAIEDSFDKKLPVKDIYAWVCKHFPYFRTAPSGWKNSIRHNLSLNKCFKKAEPGKVIQEPGKGALWCIDPAYRPNLIQALKRTPFYPYLCPSGMGQPLSLNNLVNLLPGVISGRIPSWSPSQSSASGAAWTDPDVTSAALNLMGLKGNDAIDKQPPNVRSTIAELAKEIFGHCTSNRNRSFSSSSQESIGTIPLIITSPADDHTYATATYLRCLTPESDKSAPDAAYEFETCGTDLESEVGEQEYETTDTDGERKPNNLGDSGYSGLRGRKSKGKRKLDTGTKRKRDQSPPNAKNKRVKYCSEEKGKKGQKVRGALRVRFEYSKKKSKSSETVKTRGRKKKDSPKAEICPSSDGDSGKDSPKVTSKSRRRINNVPEQNSYSKPYKTKRRTPAPTSSPYSTRSTTQTRQSRRISARKDQKVQYGSSSRRRRNSSGCNDMEDEEIKLAAGSLLHLAGFRSPPSGTMSNA